MKVSFVTPWNEDKDGISVYSGHAVGALRSGGVDVNVVGLKRYVQDGSFYRNAAQSSNLADIAHIQFNYVYFNGTMPYNNRFMSFARLLKVPSVMTVHEVSAGFEREISPRGLAARRMIYNSTIPLWNAWSLAMHREIFSKVDMILAHTKEHADTVAALVRDNGKVRVLPHPIPEDVRAGNAVSSDDAKRLLCLQGRKVLTIFGFVNARKGYETALGALRILPEDVALVIAGGAMTDNATDTEYLSMIKKRINEEGLGGRVTITGYLDESAVDKVLSATDIALAPFRTSAGSGSLSRCISAHKPIVASDIPAHREINCRVKCLELFRAEDPSGLRDAVKALMADSSRRKHLSESAREYCEKYSYRRMADATRAIYEDLLRR